ncbi:transposase [Candidatus Poribacteria bacterium]|nr:transposase [Candidatus Poribacteria bacterium]
MSKKRRTFTPEFKLQCVLDLISGRKRPVQIIREHNISDSLLARWRQQFTENAVVIFQPEQKRNNTADTRIAELERLVGQLTLELSASKKLYGYFDSR